MKEATVTERRRGIDAWETCAGCGGTGERRARLDAGEATATVEAAEVVRSWTCMRCHGLGIVRKGA